MSDFGGQRCRVIGGRERPDVGLYRRYTAPLRDWGIAAALGAGEARCNFVAQGFGGDDRVDDEFTREAFDVDVGAVLALQPGLGFSALFVAQALQFIEVDGVDSGLRSLY